MQEDSVCTRYTTLCGSADLRPVALVKCLMSPDISGDVGTSLVNGRTAVTHTRRVDKLSLSSFLWCVAASGGAKQPTH